MSNQDTQFSMSDQDTQISEDFSYAVLAQSISEMNNPAALQEALHKLDFGQISELATTMLFLKPAYDKELKKINDQSKNNNILKPLPKRGTSKVTNDIKTSTNEDVKLKTVENPWKPRRLSKDCETSGDEGSTQELYKNVRGILNKLTPQNFDKLVNKFIQLPIKTKDQLICVIQLIFEKLKWVEAEPNYSKIYANLGKVCSTIEVSTVGDDKETKVRFRKLLINRCQIDFEECESEMLDLKKFAENIKNCTDHEGKKKLELEYEEKKKLLRMKWVGNVRFLGELYKLQMLTTGLLFRIIKNLLSTPGDESLECLCFFLSTIGRDLETIPHPELPAHQLNPFFQRMSDLVQKGDGSKVSARVRFMLQDVIELKKNKWVSRKEVNDPKTIDQITREAERDAFELEVALRQPPPRMNRQNRRPDDKINESKGGFQNEDGWVNHGRQYKGKFTSASRPSYKKIEPNVLTNSIFTAYSERGPTYINNTRCVVKTLYNADTIQVFVRDLLVLSLEAKVEIQKNIGQLLTGLMDGEDCLVTPEVFADQFFIIFNDDDGDIAMDVPEAWELQAQLVVPIISAEKMDFSHFKAACSTVLNTEIVAKLLIAVLNLLVKEKGTSFVRKVWDSSNVNLKDFLPSNANLDAFIEGNSLDYLTWEAPKDEASCDQAEDSMGQLRETMLTFMQKNRPCEELVDLISTNVGDDTGDPQFIQALMTAICEACISRSNVSFDYSRFKQYEKLIQRFVDNQEDRELVALNAVQNLAGKLDQPQRVILSIINYLMDHSFITNESFCKWSSQYVQ